MFIPPNININNNTNIAMNSVKPNANNQHKKKNNKPPVDKKTTASNNNLNPSNANGSQNTQRKKVEHPKKTPVTEKNNGLSKLVIGINDRDSETYIPSKNRTSNTLVLGSKFTGKTSRVLPAFFNQDLLDNKCGATVIVSKNEVAYNLYALAKSYKRDVVLLKPSINNEISNNLLWKNEYQYDYINEYIINYKEAIKKKQIVIIDMELLKHKIDGIKAVAMLLQQLELDMQETDITQKTPHYLYVDDAQYFLPFLENILYYGDEFNIGTILFLQSRKQLQRKNKSYATLINNNVRNLLLLSTLADEDVEYYKERFFEYKQAKYHYKRNPNEILYEVLDANCNRRCGLADISKLQSIDWENIYKKAKTLRTKLLKEKRLEFEKKILNSLKNKYSEDEYLECDAQENILNEEEQELISHVERELSDNLPEMSESINLDLGSVEPTPVDMSLFEGNLNNEPIEDYPKETLEKKELSVEVLPKKDFKKIKENKIKEIIKIREKSVKRNVSTKIFNNYKSDFKYFEESFDFIFE